MSRILKVVLQVNVFFFSLDFFLYREVKSISVFITLLPSTRIQAPKW